MKYLISVVIFAKMLPRLLTNFQYRLLNLRIQRYARGDRGKRKISENLDGKVSAPDSGFMDHSQSETRHPEKQSVDDLMKRPIKSKASALLDEAITDYLKEETAEHQDPWSSPPYSLKGTPTQPKSSADRPGVDPRETSIFLFPGQGAQYVGMAKDLVEYPNVADMFHRASDILGYDLLRLCMEGPLEELNRTVRCQPAIFVTSLACVEKARAKRPVAVRSCVAAAGFSVGEIAALVFADAFSFEAGIRLIKVRAEAMQQASEQEASGLMTVFVRADSKLKEAIAAAKDHMKSKGHPNPVCQVANYLFTQGKVIGGHEEALQFIEDHAADFNLRCKRLPVSGAFHTPLMASASEILKEHLRSMKIAQPLITVHSNVEGRIYRSPEMIQRFLAKQVVSPVYWEQIIHGLYERKEGRRFPDTFEMGPGRQLGIMLRKTNAKAANFYFSYDVSSDKSV